nr:uncharacterized protein LOC128701361 [Cherax quadricarinatus]
MNTSVGHIVQCQVERKANMTQDAKIVYMTNDVLLHEYLKSKNLKNVSCIIVEAQERTIELDLLLGMIKSCLHNRPNLRIVITCATVSPDDFVKYFKQCPVLHVTGQRFPVKIEWKKVGSIGNYEEEAAKKAVKVHLSEGKGDILVVLPSTWSAINCYKRCIYLLRESKDYIALLLHEKLQDCDKQKVLNYGSHWKRKIIIASDCAEAFITFPDVKYVIDTGLTKTVLNEEPERLKRENVIEISQCSAKKRLGIVGRVCPGTCYRLYTSDDHQEMSLCDPPKIQTVDLTPLMLKMVNCGIDPEKFDFITKPSVDSWSEIRANLVKNGAVVNRKLTDIGRWIAELSIKPECGEFIYEGVRRGVGLEVIVLATLCWKSVFCLPSNEPNLKLYKARKLELCHPGGDHLTELNVFRKWLDIPNYNKHKWCAHYFVNINSLADTYDVVCDLLCQIKKAFDIDIEFVFQKSLTVDILLVNLILKYFRGGLCYYLGHPEAGYYVVSHGGRVYPDQTSAMSLLNVQPEWVASNAIFIESCGFVDKFTHIAETLVAEGVREKWMKVDIKEIKRKRLILVSEECVGDELACSLQEFLLDKFLRSEALVSFKHSTNALQLFATDDCQSDHRSTFLAAFPPLMTKFQLESCLQHVGSKIEGVTALIGAGGIISNILTPDESRIVIIHCDDPQRMFTEKVLNFFRKYGDIADYQKYDHKSNSNLWGHFTYKKIKSAKRAIRTENIENNGITAQANGINNLVVKIQWPRVPSVEPGFIYFTEKEHMDMAGSLKFFSLKPPATECRIRQSLATALSIDPYEDITKVILPKEKKEENMKMLSQVAEQIQDFIQTYGVNIYVKEPYEGDSNFTAYCVFHNFDDVHIVLDNLYKHLLLNRQHTYECFHDISIFIPKRIFLITGQCFQELADETEDKGVSVAFKQLESEDVSMYLSCENAEVLAKCKVDVEKMIVGEVIDFENVGRYKMLFTRTGRKALSSIMCTTNTLILADDRIMRLSIHGSKKSRENAKDKIYILLELSADSCEYIELNEGGKPRGVMKTLMKTYGTSLRGLQVETGVAAVTLNFRNHRLGVFGSIDCVNRATDLVNKVSQTLTSNKITLTEEDSECVICLCPVDSLCSYIVECCGHAYCGRCIKLYLTDAVANKRFPLVCFVKECGTMFTWKDFVALDRDWYLEKQELMRAAVNVFVSGNREKYRYCITPLCPSVYRVSLVGIDFTCPECRAKICTTCHTYVHNGLTCAKYQSLFDNVHPREC